MNLEKRIKRHITAPSHDCLAVVLPGFEAVCRSELEKLGESVSVTGRISGGILFRARFVDILRANLHLRTAVRVLVRIHQAKVSNFSQLEKQAARVPWLLYLPMGVVPAVRVSSHKSRLFHSEAVAQRIQNQIGLHWQNLGAVPEPAARQTLYVRLDEDHLLISLDSSGDALYRRGFKSHPARAPLRETTAAAILSISGFRAGRSLVDPMCGAGTFALEAALMAKGIAPGRRRSFAFMEWPAFRPRQWNHLIKTADQAVQSLHEPRILAADQDPAACSRLAEAAARWGLEDALKVVCGDFFNTRGPGLPGPPGLAALNPPYGRRLDTPGTLKDFYGQIGATLKQYYKGWRVAVIVPEPSLAGQLPFKPASRRFRHGGLDVRLLYGKIR
ncbi:MAG: hypothetical protein P8X55_00550 [Desulfosarcinaceae bacterium]